MPLEDARKIWSKMEKLLCDYAKDHKHQDVVELHGLAYKLVSTTLMNSQSLTRPIFRSARIASSWCTKA